MPLIYQTLLAAHALAGILGLALFWMPLLSRKGGGVHKRSGKAFIASMQLVGLTAVGMTLMLFVIPLELRGALDEPPARQLQIITQTRELAQLLLTLGLLLLANSRQAVLVLRYKDNRIPLRLWGHQVLVLMLLVASLNLLYRAANDGGVLAYVFSILGLGNGLSIGRYLYRSNLPRGAWLLGHIGNVLGAGIGAHTAFLVFGGRAFLPQWISGDAQLILWLAPSVLGGITIILISRHYSRRMSPTPG